MPKIYKVGGCVRDRLLGTDTKDIDFTFVLDDLSGTPDEGFANMSDHLRSESFEIFLSTPDCFTVRAKFPKSHKFAGLTADFVMARKELGYTDDSRKPIITLGTLEDDLARRDFTVNAIAETEDGELIDIFDGQKHLAEKVLVTPLDPVVTFSDDPLRILRAFRFSITKGFKIREDVWSAMTRSELVEKLCTTVSAERVREEMFKAFQHDTLGTIRLLNVFDKDCPELVSAIFDRDLWLKPTFEIVKRK